jgi:hypothetical protein
VNIALAGVSVGLSPVLPETEAIWPGAANDWYWKTELPAIVVYLQAQHKGPWHELPALGNRFNPNVSRVLINYGKQVPLSQPADVTRCHITGTIPVWGLRLSKRSQLVPIVSEDGVVTGYATLTRRSAEDPARQIEGFTVCPPSSSTPEPLFVLLKL